MKEERRVLIVFHGKAWSVRTVRVIEHDLDRDEKVYHCDRPLGNDFETLRQAADRAEKYLRTGR